MGFWKFGSKKEIVKTYKDLNELINDLEGRGFSSFRRRLASIEPIKLEPERYLYMRNLSVTAEEWHGPNENGDGFPYEELEHNHMSFIGSRISIDHQDDIIVGMVLDSVLIPPEFEEGNFKRGGFVENIMAIDKKMVADSRFPDLVPWIEEGKVTDSSMGAHVGYTVCSICGNIAHFEDEYCEHVMPSNGFKGTIIKTSSGEEKLCYESCRDVIFFEDAIIVPLILGGLAGGEGADIKAKFLDKVANLYPITNYIIDRKKQIKVIGQGKENEEEKEKEDIYSAALDYIFAEEKKGATFLEAVNSAIEAFNLDSKLFEKRFDSKRVYVIPLQKHGTKIRKVNEYNLVEVDGKVLMLSNEEIA